MEVARRFNWQLTVFLVLSALATKVSFAYEIDTHSRVTRAAYDATILSSGTKQFSLGLHKSRRKEVAGAQKFDLRLGLNYYEVSGNGVTLRTAKLFDQVKVPIGYFSVDFIDRRWDFSTFNGQDVPYFPVDWLARGAVREDDQSEVLVAATNARTGFLSGAFLGANIWLGDLNAYDQLDANPNRNRFCNHFYDPLNDRALVLPAPLSWAACGSGEVLGSSIAWSLGRDPALPNGSGGVHANRANHFTVLDASEAMWRALTGTDNSGSVVAPTRAERDAYWGPPPFDPWAA
jgi:hypothetical protein